MTFLRSFTSSRHIVFTQYTFLRMALYRSNDCYQRTDISLHLHVEHIITNSHNVSREEPQFDPTSKLTRSYTSLLFIQI